MNSEALFTIQTPEAFEAAALRVFRFQYRHNSLYRDFCNYLHRTPDRVKNTGQIPFLPVEFFKTHTVITGAGAAEAVFTSSGTTGSRPGKHYVTDVSVYRKSFRSTFRYFYGDIKDDTLLALLPSYLEREGSSLIYMVNDLIKRSGQPGSGFYLNDITELTAQLTKLDEQGGRVWLIGVSFALLDLIEKHRFSLENTIVMETGGMKGRRKEMVREELHRRLCEGFGVSAIHSEYGMTELLSQAYSHGDGLFKCPPWMKVLIRETEDPLQWQSYGKTGGISVIDLANLYSCAFIATRDLGRVYADGSFEVLGRYDHADIRGCNLMVL